MKKQQASKLLRLLIDWLDLYYYRLSTFYHNHYDPGGLWALDGAFPPTMLLIELIVTPGLIILKVLNIPISPENLAIIWASMYGIVSFGFFPESKYYILEEIHRGEKIAPIKILGCFAGFILCLAIVFLDFWLIKLWFC